MAGWTNKGKYRILEFAYEGGTVPTNYYMVMFTSQTAPTCDSNVLTDASEVASANGYVTGGSQLAPSTGFDTLTEDDTNDKAYVQVVDVTWTASGGSIPSSGNAYYAGLTDDNATTASREVYHYWSFGADYSVSDGQEITVQDAQIDLNES